MKFIKFTIDREDELEDLVVVPGTPEDAKAFSDFLKQERAKEAQKKAKRSLQSHAASGTRKKTK